MERHCSNAQKVAEFLCTQPKVRKVHYPGLASDKGHDVAKKQMKMFGGVLAFEMKGGLDAAKTILQVFVLDIITGNNTAIICCICLSI